MNDESANLNLRLRGEWGGVGLYLNVDAIGTIPLYTLGYRQEKNALLDYNEILERTTMDFVKKLLLMKDEVNGRHEQIRLLTLSAGIA